MPLESFIKIVSFIKTPEIWSKPNVELISLCLKKTTLAQAMLTNIIFRKIFIRVLTQILKI